MVRVKGVSALLALVVFIASAGVEAAAIRVAVAANFISPMKALSAEFEAASGHRLVVAYGSSGKLYAQIVNGAPFDLFLSADQDKPARLVAGGHGLQLSRFTYAHGRLVLWSKRQGALEDPQQRLSDDGYRYLALANPRLAPYGVAAEQVLQQLDLVQATAHRRVQGENIAQTYQFVASGNADYGFVALSQVLEQGAIRRGSGWLVPPELHDPIRQDAVLLKRGASKPAAQAFMTFLRSPAAAAIIRQHGYDLEPLPEQ